MQISETKIKDVLLFEPRVFNDERGFFMETFRRTMFEERNIKFEVIQENYSRSIGKVVRGLHFQKSPTAQAKLVRCTKGSIFDVAVDIRVGSPTYGQWVGIELSDKNYKQLFIPKGFAHGFSTLTEETDVVYKVDAYYSKEDERGIMWNDPDLKVDWSVANPTISGKDEGNVAFTNLEKYFTYLKP